MDDLKRIEGKSIKSFKTTRSNKSTVLIIKFAEGGKINIAGFTNGDIGTAQLDIMVDKIKFNDIIGKRIDVVVEEYNGDNEYIIIKLREGGSIIITAYSSSEDTTASLKATIYSSDEVVKESLNQLKIKNNNMKKENAKIRFVAESFDESLNFKSNAVNEGRYINYNNARNAAMADIAKEYTGMDDMETEYDEDTEDGEYIAAFGRRADQDAGVYGKRSQDKWAREDEDDIPGEEIPEFDDEELERTIRAKWAAKREKQAAMMAADPTYQPYKAKSGEEALMQKAKKAEIARRIKALRGK